MSKFQKGDLLICVDNHAVNPFWRGTAPKIGEYYTWRGEYVEEPCNHGYVEEIKSKTNPRGYEYPHVDHWYEKVDEPSPLAELIEEIKEYINEEHLIIK